METKQTVTKDQIAAWKHQHGSVSEIELKTGERCYVRSPKLVDLEYASVHITDGKFLQFGITLFQNCFLGGDILVDEMKLMAAGSQMQEVIETVTATVKKL